MALFKKSRAAPTERPRRVLIVSAEIGPFTSGKASATIRGLADQLAGQGARVSVILPRYRRPEIDSLPLEPVLPELWVPLGGDKVKAAVFRAPLGGGEAFFIDNPKYFLRDRVFGTEHGDYLDNDERFAFFSRAVLEFILKAKLDYDVLHCHNWPTALVPLFLGTHYAGKSRFRRTASVLSLQGLSAQGQFPPESLAFTGLNWDYFTPDQLALNGKFSFLKAGMMFADALAGTAEGCRGPAGAGSGADGGGLAEILARRGDSCVTISPGADAASGAEAARQYLRLYEKALETKKGGPHGR
jgi:starch synthase